MESGPSLGTTLAVTLIPLLYIGTVVGLAIYVVMLLRRLVRGTERIASALESRIAEPQSGDAAG